MNKRHPLDPSFYDSTKSKMMSVEKAREILGETAKDMSDDDVREQIAMIKYLTESWIDEFERQIFDGKTLQEFLGNR